MSNLCSSIFNLGLYFESLDLTKTMLNLESIKFCDLCPNGITNTIHILGGKKQMVPTEAPRDCAWSSS